MATAGCGPNTADVNPPRDAPTDDPTDEPEARVYAHNASTLFALDPITFEVTTIGPMTGCSGVVDIAVNGNNQLFGSGSTPDGTGILSIDPSTGACALAVAGGFSNALSFVPKGVLHPDKEMLVSYANVGNTNRYVSIDPDSGMVTDVGQVPPGYSSSGDIVSVEGGGTYWSAVGPCNDCLVELNPATGALVRDWGPMGHNGVWGLAYWGGSVYGFTSQGSIFKVSFDNDTLTTTPIANNVNLSYYGAGSTTKAPLVVN